MKMDRPCRAQVVDACGNVGGDGQEVGQIVLQAGDLTRADPPPSGAGRQVKGDHAQFRDIAGKLAAQVVFQPVGSIAQHLPGPAAGVAQERGRPLAQRGFGIPRAQQGMDGDRAQDGKRGFLDPVDRGVENVGRIVDEGEADDGRGEPGHLEQGSARAAVEHGEIDAQTRPCGEAQDEQFGRILKIGNQQDGDCRAHRQTCQTVHDLGRSRRSSAGP
jgi:hypothetical protein